MNIKVYPYVTEDIYYGRKHICLSAVCASSNIRDRLEKEFGIRNNVITFIEKIDYSKFIKMRNKKENTKIFNVDVCLPDGTLIPCTCFLTKKEIYSEYLEEIVTDYSGKIIENTDKEELDRAYRYNARLDDSEEW
jgi:Mg/Co/Ni transporter MgtE